MTATAEVSAAREQDVVDAVRDAAVRRRPLRIKGAGTWMGAGRPVASDGVLDVSGLRGIVEYEPGDLTLTAWAGTSLAEIAAATARHRQWLPLDAPATAAATLGATLATASAGPLAGSIGLPRDVALGVAFVSGAGDVIRGGGRVVKNVAGFDLVRLTVGAWGTLGVLTQATVRLRARTACDRTVALAAEDDLSAQLTRVRAIPFTPLATEIVNAALAARLGFPARTTVMVRGAGQASTVAALCTAVGAASGDEVDTGAWSLLSAATAETPYAVRVSARPSMLSTIWAAVAERPGVLAHASVARGVVRCCAADGEAMRAVLEAAAGLGVTRIGEQLPAALWRELPAVAPQHRLNRGLREAFDALHLLNPGILGETA